MPEHVVPVSVDPRLPGWFALTSRQIGYQLRLITRSRRSLLAGVLLPVLVLVTRGPDAGGPAAGSALVGGLASLGVISSAFVTHANTLVIGRESGVLRRWRVTPLPPSCFFAGKIAATVIVANTSALLTVIVASFTGVPVSVVGTVWMLIPITAGALVWASLGTAVSGFIPTAAAAYPLLTVIYLPIALASGALGHQAHPAWLTTAATYLPARPVILATTEALRHTGGWPGLTIGQLAVLTAWVIAGLAVAVVCFRWDPRRSPQPRGGRLRSRLRSDGSGRP